MASDDAGKPDLPTSGFLPTSGVTSGAPRGSSARSGHEGLAEKPGESIGPYRLLSVLGEGGFGVVWLAEQREPLQRRVALKVIKPGMDSRAVVARFEQERQALAVMDHPNVAKVFDAGTTARGQPYFVMEYVAGEPITDFCDRNRFTTKQRLELFISVCEAVQHAHTKGIIHRDIKPTNVLVVPAEPASPAPTAKVIDFGVAKAITHTLTDKTIFTEQGQILGTPEYMSPEQAEMSATGVDTRSDVYSLGVLLYELLTGVLPFDSKSLRAAGYAEIQRIIREVDPPRPSTRLSTLGEEASSVAQRHRSEPLAMSKELRKELEWVPLKALRKNRNERYGSPADMARDLRNYLEGRPLAAGPESAGYRARKFVRRNRAAVITSGAVAAALAVGLTLAGLSYVRAERANAEAELERASKVADVLNERALNLLDQGRAEEAEPALREALDTYKKLFPKGSAEVARSLNNLGGFLMSVGRTDEAEPLFREALAMNRRLGPDDENIASNLNNVGLALQAQKKYAEAEPFFRDSLAICKRVFAGDHERVAQALNNVGFDLQPQGNNAGAEKLFREALEMNKRLLKSDDPGIASGLSNVGYVLIEQDRAAEAESLLREAVAINQRRYGDHPNTANYMKNLARSLDKQGKVPEAITFAEQAAGMASRTLPEGHPVRQKCDKVLADLKAKSAGAGAVPGGEQPATEAAKVGS